MKTTRFFASAVLIALFVIPASAQEHETLDERSENFWRLMELQVSQSFDSELENIKITQLENIVRMGALYRHKVNFSDSVPAIINYYKGCADEYGRALAIAALQSIDSVEGRSYLRKRINNDELESARSVMVAILSAYTSSDPVAVR